MNALSIRQPWPAAVIYSDKRVENRTWWTSYRGPLLLHAGKIEKESDAYWLIEDGWLRKDAPRPRGGFVGWAVMTGCERPGQMAVESRWRDVGQYGFLLAEAEPLPFLPWPGSLGIFNVAKADLLAKAQVVLDPADAKVWEKLLRLLRGET